MESAQAAAQARRAMVVDDGAVERIAGKGLLEKLGFSVITAESGEKALHLLEQYPAELVLCDISMPGMDGLALLEATRGHARPPLFIMSTSHDDAQQAEASLRSGARAYLAKPLRFDTLRQAVNEVMAEEPR